MMLFAAALAGAVLGFLFYNFNPASIFMGDTGIMFLGFVLATTAIQTNQKSSTRRRDPRPHHRPRRPDRRHAARDGPPGGARRAALLGRPRPHPPPAPRPRPLAAADRARALRRLGGARRRGARPRVRVARPRRVCSSSRSRPSPSWRCGGSGTSEVSTSAAAPRGAAAKPGDARGHPAHRRAMLRSATTLADVWAVGALRAGDSVRRRVRASALHLAGEPSRSRTGSTTARQRRAPRFVQHLSRAARRHARRARLERRAHDGRPGHRDRHRAAVRAARRGARQA